MAYSMLWYSIGTMGVHILFEGKAWVGWYILFDGIARAGWDAYSIRW